MLPQKKGSSSPLKKTKTDSQILNEQNELINKIKRIRHFYLKQYDVLNNLVIKKLNPNLDNFRDGDFENINREEIGEETRKTLINKEDNFSENVFGNVTKYNYNPLIFDDFINYSFKVLNGMNSAILLKDSNESLSNQIENYENILKDSQSIRDYYNERFNKGSFIPEIITDLSVVPTLKLKYQIYIDRYSMPESGIFDSKLLAEIEKELEEN